MSPIEPSRKNSLAKAANSAITYPFGLKTAIMELFDIGPVVAISALAFAGAVFIAAVLYFVHSAPPRTLTISAGPDGSQFYKTALKYADILKRNGVSAKVLTSEGSMQNLDRLNGTEKMPSSEPVDLGLVQAGPASTSSDKVMSLGSVSYQPLLVFYRGKKPIEFLSELAGKRIAIGPDGSGTQAVARAVLKLNGIDDGGKTALLEEESRAAALDLQNSKIDAAFVMSESASTDILRALMRDDEIRLYSFKQANAYSRKLEYLNVLELPQGVIDPGTNVPDHDIALVGPMVELVAVKSFHPALVDLMVEAATEVHARPGIFQRRGDFPKAVEHTIHLSDEAVSFYKSGKSYLYRMLPFWLASLLTRLVLIFVPVLVVLVPTLRAIPAFFRWIAQLRIRRRYRELRLLEQNFVGETDPTRRELIRQEFDRVEERVNQMKVSATFADQFYALRGHIDYVRRILERPQGMA